MTDGPAPGSAGDVRQLTARLRGLSVDARAQLDALRSQRDAVDAAVRDVSTDDEHDPEGATLAFERSQISALISASQERVAEISQALERCADGSYGVCLRCGGAIGTGRLDARPTATTCITCARL